MPDVVAVKTRTVDPTFRVSAVQGMFDIPSMTEETAEFRASLPDAEDDWQIGLIVGPSGSGKTSLAAEAWPDAYVAETEWDARAVIDQFPTTDDSVEDAVRLLTAVGLATPKAWIRPHHVLSTGQQARADLALALARSEGLTVLDEYTSTVDRVVAKAMSHAVQKTVRRGGVGKFVAVSCHSDVIPWLQPDWVWDTTDGVLRTEGVQRPPIHLRLEQAGRDIWPVFADNHYLTGEIANSARCFTAWVRLGDDDDEWRLAGFFSVIPAIGLTGWRRGHRTVVLPDFQGLGIGNLMIEEIAEWLYEEEGIRFRAVTSARPIIFHRMKRPEMWRCVFAPHMKAGASSSGAIKSTSAGRLTTSWEYIPQALRGIKPEDVSMGSSGSKTARRGKGDGARPVSLRRTKTERPTPRLKGSLGKGIGVSLAPSGKRKRKGS